MHSLLSLASPSMFHAACWPNSSQCSFLPSWTQFCLLTLYSPLRIQGSAWISTSGNRLGGETILLCTYKYSLTTSLRLVSWGFAEGCSSLQGSWPTGLSRSLRSTSPWTNYTNEVSCLTQKRRLRFNDWPNLRARISCFNLRQCRKLLLFGGMGRQGCARSHLGRPERDIPSQ